MIACSGSVACGRDTVWAMPTRLVHLVADANDPSRLARFWSCLLGWDIADETAEEVAVWPGGSTCPCSAAVTLALVLVPGHGPGDVMADPASSECGVLDPRPVHRPTAPLAATVTGCRDPAALARF